MAKVIKASINLRSYMEELMQNEMGIREDEFTYVDFQKEAERLGRTMSLTHVKTTLEKLERDKKVTSRMVILNKTRKRVYRFV